MKRKCDHCDQPATHHSVEIIKGKKIEKHLCDLHAQEHDMAVKGVQPINELLTNFVKLHSGGAAQQEMVCETCGLTFADFREQSLLGCPDCYKAFDETLRPLLERAHEGASQHLGKVPRRAGASEHRHTHVLRMRKRLEEAVANEDYELAARLRDDIHQMEEPE